MDTFDNIRDILANSFGEFLKILLAYLPNLITALLLLLLGWLCARLVRTLWLRFGSGLDRLTAALRRRPWGRDCHCANTIPASWRGSSIGWCCCSSLPQPSNRWGCRAWPTGSTSSFSFCRAWSSAA
ncbi:mechanosensitive ion channel family protein [Marinobacterium aestuariivivens]|uniref:Mechanosensitive ion channel protein MscS n=1 Tax=Marinobacterium aestuariivivens TaxID=1698799 RepID=A0ABW2A3V7_9GAMM